MDSIGFCLSRKRRRGHIKAENASDPLYFHHRELLFSFICTWFNTNALLAALYPERVLPTFYAVQSANVLPICS